MSHALVEVPLPMKDLKTLTWPEFDELSPREKGQYLLAPEGNLQAVVFSQQFNRELLDHLIELAELIRSSHYNEQLRAYVRTLLATKSCALYFTQPSTRTFTSFSLAAQTVGMINEEIRDPEMSSVYKGESELDTLLTLSELVDTVIMRQGDRSVIERFAFEVITRGLPTRILNGGSGSDQHPTQALLELYTLVSHFDLNRTDATFEVAIVGDCKRSRTARSLSYLLALYPRIKQTFIAPEELQMGEDLIEYLDENGISYELSDDLDGKLPETDAVYMMRIQDEYGTTSEETRQRYEDYRLTTERVARMKETACVLHPLPRRAELPIEVDADPRAMYWEAVNRGKFIRVALLLHMFGKDDIEKIKARAY
ncbi:MAG: aspartate carbamoyltransferase [Planctomycetota bacterium]|nr:aspartate carbamoyltransferase [Planctomycetota bacterium]